MISSIRESALWVRKKPRSLGCSRPNAVLADLNTQVIEPATIVKMDTFLKRQVGKGEGLGEGVAYPVHRSPSGVSRVGVVLERIDLARYASGSYVLRARRLEDGETPTRRIILLQ